jgi:hypothetical protein
MGMDTDAPNILLLQWAAAVEAAAQHTHHTTMVNTESKQPLLLHYNGWHSRLWLQSLFVAGMPVSNPVKDSMQLCG